MVSNGEMFDDGKIVILDSGSDVSCLPHDLGREIDSPADEAHVSLRDCEGKELQVAKVRTASIVVENEDGNQAELETHFVVSESVKSCILSLGQLYRAGWSVQQSNRTMMDRRWNLQRTFRVPAFFQRNALAIRGEVCRVVATEDSCLDVSMVRAVVELDDKFRPERIRNNHWETTVGGNPFMRCTGENFIDPSAVWPASFECRLT